MKSRILTIMLTDIKGFTARTSTTTREGLRGLIKKHEDMVKPIIAQMGGSIVKTIGDAFLVTFESPTDAVLCGLLIQDRLMKHNAGVEEDERLEVRIAVSSGEVEVSDEGDVFGEAVNLAARIEGITETNQIYFTESVYLAMNKQEVPTSEIGWRRFKGIPEAVKVYRVIQDRESEPFQKLIQRLEGRKSFVIQKERGTRRLHWGVVFGSAALILVLVLYYFFVHIPTRQLEQIKALIAQGHYKTALELLDNMRKKDIADQKITELIGQAVKLDVDDLASKKDFDGAIARLKNHLEDRPYLEKMEEDLKLFYLKKLEYRLIKKQRPYLVFGELKEVFPKDAELLYKASLMMAQNGRLYEAFKGFQIILDINPGFRDREPILTHTKAALANDRGASSTRLACDLIGEYYLDRVRAELLNMLENKDKNLRLSAYRVLDKYSRQDLDKIDLLPYHLMNIRNNLFSSSIIKEAINYFYRIDDEASVKEAVAGLRVARAHPEVLSTKFLLIMIDRAIARLEKAIIPIIVGNRKDWDLKARSRYSYEFQLDWLDVNKEGAKDFAKRVSITFIMDGKKVSENNQSISIQKLSRPVRCQVSRKKVDCYYKVLWRYRHPPMKHGKHDWTFRMAYIDRVEPVEPSSKIAYTGDIEVIGQEQFKTVKK